MPRISRFLFSGISAKRASEPHFFTKLFSSIRSEVRNNMTTRREPLDPKNFTSSASRLIAYQRRLRDLRTDHDLKEHHIAAILHISQRTYSGYELGETNPSIDSLVILAEFYDVSLYYLLVLTDEKGSFRH